MNEENESSVICEGGEIVVNASPDAEDSISSCKSNEITSDPIARSENIDETSVNIEQTMLSENSEKLPKILPSEISETASEILVSENHAADEQCSTANVMVKEELCSEEIDYDMPIAKTPMHTTNYSVVYEPLEGTNRNQTKSALDEYLDGMVTPIAPPLPRLRVKTELALFKTPQPAAITENNDPSNCSEAMNTEIINPPPSPRALSSHTNTDFVADGIATPRISLASINRLRVKSEFTETAEHNEDDPPEDFFDDLINTKNIEREAGELSPDATDDTSGNEQIPDDYFDDLLIDKLKERIDAAKSNDLEIKYSDRLKELESLQNELRRVEEKKAHKNRKKQKKSKKKSKKRSRSRSPSPHSAHYDRNKRNRMSPSPHEQPASSSYVSRQEPEQNVLNVKRESRVDSEEEVEEILTPKQRKERAIKRATALLHYLNNKCDDNSGIFCDFPFVSTVRKLPTSRSYVQQQIYENRSPLHTVNNVRYKFNSHSSRFKTEEWGLAQLPAMAAKLAKLVGCDAEFIHNKLKTIKIPAKLSKEQQESNRDAEHEEEEELVETSSSLYSNAMTQTDDVDVLVGRRKETGYEIGVQAKPDAYSIGCQTLDGQTPTKNKDDLHNNDELPLMKLLKDLNENQLMALHSFAELIREQSASSNAMEMYKIQMQIMDIYKISQIPSTLDAAKPAIVNNYKTMATATATRSREQSNLCIQSVKSADGRQYTVNDPRQRRNAHDNVAATSSKYEQHPYAARPSNSYSQTYFTGTAGEHDGRYAATSTPSSRHHPYVAYGGSQSPPASVKRYGRGGTRR